jgi:hypothetical protein
MFYRELAKALNRSVSSVRRKCQEMGLKKDRSLSTKRSYEENPHLREIRSKKFKENASKGLGGQGWNRGTINLPEGVTKEDVLEAYQASQNVHLAAESCGITSHMAWRICNKEGAMRSVSEAQKQRTSYPHIPALKGKESPNWKGGLGKNNGYVIFTSGPNHGRGFHTVLMEEWLGRKLEKGELVHHINGIRDDNFLPIEGVLDVSLKDKEQLARDGIGNLQLLTRAQHMMIHAIDNDAQTERIVRRHLS